MTALAHHDPLTLAQAARIWRKARREHRDRLVWLYAIQAGVDGPVKIGLTQKSPAKRVRTLQQANAETLRGLAAWRAFPFEEKQLHDEFADARLRGEWFRPVPEPLTLVLALGGDFDEWERGR
jgi:Meiotically Up-regulated Gene 113 (MUG113) protein